MRELESTLTQKDVLTAKLEESKMKVIDLEIELNESSLILSEVLKMPDGPDMNNIKRSKSFFELQKSGKVVGRLDKGRLSRSDNELDMMHCRDKKRETPNISKLSRKISELTKEMAIKNSKLIEQQRCISILEEALRENNNIAEFEQLLAVVRSKDERINELEQIVNKNSVSNPSDGKEKRILELEDALKESFLIAAEREKIFYEEEQRRIETLRRMGKMEQRIRSLQNASAMNCETCSSVLKRLKRLEDSLQHCQTNREHVLRQLSHVVQDVLEGLISEKDSLIAELEVKGVLDESETTRCDTLKTERDRLLNRLKTENERILELEQWTEPVSAAPEGSLPVDLTLTDELLQACDDNEEDIPATVL